MTPELTIDPALLYIMEPPWWKYGGRLAFWERNADVINEAIKGLPPIAEVTAGEATARSKFHPRPFPGGIRIPHFHVEDKVYPVKPERWEKFVKGVKANFAKRLADAQGISFDQIMEVSIAIEPLV